MTLNKAVLLALVPVLALVFSGCAAPGSKAASAKKMYEPKMVQHYKGSVFEATDKGYYTAELIPRPKEPVVGKNDADLIIHDYKATDIPGLRIEVTPFMPGKDVTSPDKPVVEDAGRGLYFIKNLHYTEPGNWSLKIAISGPEDDKVVLELPEVVKK